MQQIDSIQGVLQEILLRCSQLSLTFTVCLMSVIGFSHALKCPCLHSFPLQIIFNLKLLMLFLIYNQDEERRRNSLGLDILFLHISHPLAVEINSFSKQMNDSPEFIEVKVEKKIDPKFRCVVLIVIIIIFLLFFCWPGLRIEVSISRDPLYQKLS
jgi:amino acid permease